MRSGDEGAFEILYERHHASLLASCRRILGNREDGEDALQEAFVRAHRALRAGRPPDAVRPWLFAIARNRCRTMLAARRESAMPIDDLEPGFDGLADDVRRRAELRELVADLGRLPDSQREALVLFEFGDLSHAEIAATIGCPTGKVKALVFQARTTLIAERDARGTPCEEIREQLEAARGAVLRRGSLRRHVRQCEPCRAYGGAVARRRASVACPPVRHAARRATSQPSRRPGGPSDDRFTTHPGRGLTLSAKTLFATLALTAAAALPAGADASAPDRVHAGESPLPPGACATHGAVGLAYEVGVNCRVVDVDGHPRRFIVYVPATAPVTGPRAPVVFMFHGSTGTGEQFLRISGWREQADATGLVAVFPTGLRYRVLDSGRLSTKWNDYSLASQVDLSERPPGYPADAPWPANDVGFVDAMMADLGARLPIDRHRVYASGFSNGAGFTARLAVERSTVLAAAAFSGGALPSAQAPARPIPMYMTVGTLDDRVLAQTGPPPLARLPLDPLALLAEPVIKSTVGAHLATAGLDPRDFGALGRPRSTSFRWPATGTGQDGALFRFAALDGLAHKYPNGRNNLAGFAAAPEFWDFFQAHRLPLSAPAGGAAIRAGGRGSATHFTPPIGTDKGS